MNKTIKTLLAVVGFAVGAVVGTVLASLLM